MTLLGPIKWSVNRLNNTALKTYDVFLLNLRFSQLLAYLGRTRIFVGGWADRHSLPFPLSPFSSFPRLFSSYPFPFARQSGPLNSARESGGGV